MSSRSPRSDLRIWYTGENVRPPTFGYDLTLSFDVDDLGGRNVYCPQILQSIDWFGTFSSCHTPTNEVKRLGRPVMPAEIRKPREDFDGFLARRNSMCAFLGNGDDYRVAALRVLSAYLPVDVYGSFTHRPVSDKLSIAREYRYVFAFENDVYPGYVTEKCLDAWACGSIPVWRGIDTAGYINQAAAVNAMDVTSLAVLGMQLRDTPDDVLAKAYSAVFTTSTQFDAEAVVLDIQAVLGI